MVACIVFAAGSAAADERKHIALLDFGGPHGSTVRGKVMRVAGTRCWIASASKLEGRTVREFARDHALDLVVDGVVEQHGSHYRVRIRILRGATGRAIAGISALLRQPTLDRATELRFEHALLHALARLPARSGDETESAHHPVLTAP
jgi:hypothetical protein